MAKPVLALGHLAFDEDERRVIYRYGKADDDKVEMDYLDFIACLTIHIPDKGQVMIRYYGLYSNAHRGKVRKRSPSPRLRRTASALPILEPPPLGDHLHRQETSATCTARGTLLIRSRPAKPIKGITLPV
jgi:hypothetical protein